MAVYNSSNVKTKVFIHNANVGTQGSSSGNMAKDIYDYIVTLDSTNNAVLSITHCRLNGDRILTLVVGGS